MVRRSLILWACFFGILAAADKGYLNSYSDSQTSVSPDKDALELNENNDPSTFKEKEEGEGLLDDGSSVNEDQGVAEEGAVDEELGEEGAVDEELEEGGVAEDELEEGGVAEDELEEGGVAADTEEVT
eukprot:gene2901-1139_t